MTRFQTHQKSHILFSHTHERKVKVKVTTATAVNSDDKIHSCPLQVTSPLLFSPFNINLTTEYVIVVNCIMWEWRLDRHSNSNYGGWGTANGQLLMLKWPWAKNTILSCSGVAAKYTLIDSNWQQLYWSATLRDCEWLCEGEAEKKAPRALCPFFKQCVYPVCEIWLCNYCKMGARAVFFFFAAALIQNTILF